MGKTSNAPSYPPYYGGNVSVNGKTVATASKKGNTIYSTYNMPSGDKSIYDYAQNALISSMPQLNVFSPEVQQGIDAQIDAYKNQGLQSLNNMYTPILNNLKNDMAYRFGNLNNSMFIDRLNKIENSRASALSNLAQNILMQQDNLYNNELSRRYNYLNLMNSLQNQMTNNMFNYLNLANSNSDAGNKYGQSAYNANMSANNNLLNNNLGYSQFAMDLLPLALTLI